MRIIARALAALTIATSLLPAPVLADVPMERVASAIEEGRLGEVKAVIVEQGGEIVYEQYFGGAAAEDRHDIRSAGKSITALVLGQAIAEGHIASLDETPLAALGAPEEYSAISLRDLVTMSSALNCNDWDEKSPGHEDKMYPKREWTPHALAIPLRPNYERDRNGVGWFSYCTAGVFLAGRYIARQAAEPFDEYVQRSLFSPLGISDVKWKRSRAGEVQAGGQIEMRPRDLVRIGRLVLDNGVYNGQQLVPAAWIEEMLTPYVRATDSDDYGYLWWLRAYRYGESAMPGWYMLGNGGNTVAVFEELDAVVTVVATNYNEPGMHQIARDIIERGALPILLGGKAPE